MLQFIGLYKKFSDFPNYFLNAVTELFHMGLGSICCQWFNTSMKSVFPFAESSEGNVDPLPVVLSMLAHPTVREGFYLQLPQAGISAQGTALPALHTLPYLVYI